jgi:DNA-directed RNA polymerase subunit RPC12/RpoP
MQYWCFNCSKITLSNAGNKCQYCGSEAIEEMRHQNNPAQYIPFNVPAQPHPQSHQFDDREERTFFTISIMRQMPLVMPPFLPMTPISFIRFINLAGQENQSAPVADEKYEQLEKIATL